MSSANRPKNPPRDPARGPSKKEGPKQPGAKIGNSLKQPQNRWQRAVRYTWDKNRGRG